MTVTSKYQLEETDYGTTGWNGILTSNMQSLDDYLHTYLRYPVANTESISAYDAVCVLGGEFYPAASGEVTGYRRLVVGVAIEEGASGENIRAQRCGPITNPLWDFTGSGEVYLGAAEGSITETVTAHKIGFSITPTSIIVQL